ncbi:hypothetical protein [Maricaulis sp.]|uniref:hypothetical protein n=1 Tax=Maricaulis sp. TaxID=1486257 RepID=UPI00261570C3|nr:hypothetical protein [Maricaulis sp.]
MAEKSETTNERRWELEDWYPWLFLVERGARMRDVAVWAGKTSSAVSHARRRLEAASAGEYARIAREGWQRLKCRITALYLSGQAQAARAHERAFGLMESEVNAMTNGRSSRPAGDPCEEDKQRDLSDDELRAFIRERIESQADRFGFRRELEHARHERAVRGEG